MLLTYKLGEVYFHFLGTDGFSCKGKKYGVLEMMTEPARKKRHLKINTRATATILFAFYNVNEEPCNWISLSAVKVNTEN